jgi:hypothetical protein
MSFSNTAKSESFLQIKLVPLPKTTVLKDAIFITENYV